MPPVATSHFPGESFAWIPARHYHSCILAVPNSLANQQKLLLILSDGKPHDLDLYEGRYGIDDTSKSIQEARNLDVRPFCVTIDREGGSYLPHIFGAQGFTLLHQADQLSHRLPRLYAQLTRN